MQQTMWDFFHLKDHGLTEATSNGRSRIDCALSLGRSDRPVAGTLADIDSLGVVKASVRIKTSHCLQYEIQNMFSIIEGLLRPAGRREGQVPL